MVANAKKVIAIEKVQGFILMELYRLYIADYQKLENLQTPRPKIVEFLGKLYIDIEGLLSVIFLDFQYFFSIKDNT